MGQGKFGIGRYLFSWGVFLVCALSGPITCLAQNTLKGSIAGRLVDESGNPVPGATVVLHSAAQGMKIHERRTDATGSFSFAGLDPATFRLAVHPPANSDYVGDTFLPAVESPSIQVEPGKVFRVTRIVRKGGRLEVFFVRAAGRWFPSTCPCSFELRSSKGAFFTDPEPAAGRLLYRALPVANDYRLSFEVEGHASQVLSPIAIVAGQATTVELRYDPDDATGIAGILRASSGTPISDAIIYLRKEGEQQSAGTARSDTQGRFKIVGLRPGSYVISAGRQLGQVTVIQGALTAVDLVWSQLGSDTGPRRWLALLDWLSPPPLSLGTWLFMQGPTPPPASPPPPPTWPFRSRLWIGVCDPPNLPKQVPDTDPLYKRVVPEITAGVQDGLDCLRNKASGRAEKLERYVNPGGLPSFFFPRTLRFAFNCPGQSSAACAWSPSLPVPVIYFASNQTDCGCLRSVVFHELLHTTSTGVLECPSYRCAKECFACAAQVPTSIKNAAGVIEDCSKCPTCSDLN